MDKEDARYQSLEQLHERRKQVVRLHRKGCGVMEIASLSGLSVGARRNFTRLLVLHRPVAADLELNRHAEVRVNRPMPNRVEEQCGPQVGRCGSLYIGCDRLSGSI